MTVINAQAIGPNIMGYGPESPQMPLAAPPDDDRPRPSLRVVRDDDRPLASLPGAPNWHLVRVGVAEPEDPALFGLSIKWDNRVPDTRTIPGDVICHWRRSN